MHEEQRSSPGDLAILVIGTDTLIEALPARPVQLAKACGALGFDLTLPASWGDELVAAAALQSLEFRGRVGAVLCSCPHVRNRLLRTGRELSDALVSLVSPPVALARELRATIGTRIRTLSFAGACPDAVAPDYDIAYGPHELFAMLRDHGIDPVAQADLYTDRIPPDRSRFLSLPGGCPDPDILWHRCNERLLVELEHDTDIPVEIAQHLISAQSVLVDAGPALGCACAGVTSLTTSTSARIAVTSLEPTRSPTPVFEKSSDVPLVRELPAELSSPPGGRRPPMAVTPPGALSVRGSK